MAEFTILMGGNRGGLRAVFAQATGMIEARIGPVLATSRDHWTEPWGFEDDQLFLDRAIVVGSAMEPPSVMKALLAIEQELGRERPAMGGYAPRTIDLDILFIGEEIFDLPGLTVPHPRVHERAFALGPAADVVPGLVHPVLQRSVMDLLNTVLQGA